MNYEGGYDHPFINGLWNYLTFDNFEVIMEDDAGNTWSVDSSSEIGYIIHMVLTTLLLELL